MNTCKTWISKIHDLNTVQHGGVAYIKADLTTNTEGRIERKTHLFPLEQWQKIIAKCCWEN